MGLKTEDERNQKRHYHQTTPNTIPQNVGMNCLSDKCFKADGKYTYHHLRHLETMHFSFVSFSLNNITRLLFVTETDCVLCET